MDYETGKKLEEHEAALNHILSILDKQGLLPKEKKAEKPEEPEQEADAEEEQQEEYEDKPRPGPIRGRRVGDKIIR